MPSIPSIDRQKVSTVFRSVELSHVRDVLPLVEDRLREVLTGEETLPDVALLAALLGRVQVGGTRGLIRADNAHDEELANDNEPRQRRDVAGERVHRKLVEIRRIADVLFGPERSGEVLGTSGPTAPVTEGERLWRQAEDTAGRLEAPAFTATVATASSLEVDSARLAAELRSDNDAFRAALDAVALEQRRAEASLEVKKARLAEATRIDLACSRIYEGFFILADREDLAGKLLRALRRTRRRAASAGGASPAPDTVPPADGKPPAAGKLPAAGEPTEGAPSSAALSAVTSPAV